MAIQTELRTSVWERVRQSVLFVRELKRIAQNVVAQIDAGTLTGDLLVVYQVQLVDVKAKFTSWPFGSLTDANVRTRMVQEWPDVYASAAAVASEFSAISARFQDLQAALEALLVVARARGQLVDADPTTGLKTSQLLASPDTDALRATAVAVRDAILG